MNRRPRVHETSGRIASFVRRIRQAACLTSCVAATSIAQTGTPDTNTRLVHRFDFDERNEGNLESIPKYWSQFSADGFPRFCKGQFDERVGHDGAPSFHLLSEGHNVAYRYLGDETRVRTLNDYVVVGWIQGEGLEHARASLSAFYLDHKGEPILETERFSRLIGGEEDGGEWHRVEVFLPSGPVQARSIGLTVWLVQPDVWDVRPRAARHIERRDVRATAWFDDIDIYRLPRVEIQTAAPGNVLTPTSEPLLSVAVTDAQIDGLRATLDLLDVYGRPIRTDGLEVRGVDDTPPTMFDLAALPAGLYRARVTVHTDDRLLADRSLVFSKVGASLRESVGGSRAFGVVLDAEDRSDGETELALLRILGVGSVKVPVWSGLPDVADLTESTEAEDALLYELLKSRIAVIGVLAGPPSALSRTTGVFRHPLLGVLSENPDGWREYLARVVAPYSSIFRSWQIGADGDVAVYSDPRLPSIVGTVREEMESLTTAPYLTIPGSLSWAPFEEASAADDLCLAVDSAIGAGFIGDHLSAYRQRDLHVASLYIAPLGNDGTNRLSRVRDWCKRVLRARQSGIATVMVPQLWHTGTSITGEVTEPIAEFNVLRTLEVIADTTPGDEIPIAQGVTCLSFHHDDRTVLAMWDDRAGPAGRTHTLQLGGASRVVDMWGRVTELDREEDGRQRVHLSGDPVFVPNVDRWLAEFRAGVVLTPSRVEFAIDAHRHALTIVNTKSQPLGGSVRIEPPSNWEVRPRQFKFSVGSGESFSKPLEMRFDRGETAGTKTCLVRVTFDGETRYSMVIPIDVELGIADLEVWGFALVKGANIVVRHGVTNRSNHSMSFRALAAAPGQLLQHRPLPNLEPGQTTVLEYRFADAASLQGRQIRLNLRELNGPRIHNIEVEVP